LFSTLEDLDTKILIRSLIFLSFEQKKQIRKLQAQVKDFEKDFDKDKNMSKEPIMELRKLKFILIYFEFKIEKHVKFNDRAEFFTKLSDRESDDTRAFLANEKGKNIIKNVKIYLVAFQNYNSRIPDNISASRNKETNSIIKVLPVRSSSVIIKNAPKKSKVLNSSLMDGIVGLKKNTKPLKKFL
jgi:hypothetical protein